jgi:hypothetical protein
MHSRSTGGRDETIKEGERKRGPRSERMRGKRREEATDIRGKDEDRERKKPQENESSEEEEVSKVRKKEREEAEERGMPNQTSEEEENDSPMDSEDMSEMEKYERLSAAYCLSLFPTNPNEQRKKKVTNSVPEGEVGEEERGEVRRKEETNITSTHEVSLTVSTDLTPDILLEEKEEGEPKIVKKEGRKVGKEEKKQWLASCKAQKDILEREERSERERREKVKMGRRMSGVEFRIEMRKA